MIKARDFRIGNIVQIKEGAQLPPAYKGLKYFPVTGEMVWELQKLEIKCELSENMRAEWIYEPIPLTETWLEKFGFAFKEESGTHATYEKQLETNPANPDSHGRTKTLVPLFYYKGHKPVGDQDDRYEKIIAFKWGEFMEEAPRRDVRINFVHQLQNLFFALTGHELEIIKVTA